MQSRVDDAFACFLQWCEPTFPTPFTGFGFSWEGFCETSFECSPHTELNHSCWIRFPSELQYMLLCSKIASCEQEQNLGIIDWWFYGFRTPPFISNYIYPVFLNLILGILYTCKYVFIYTCMHVCVNICVYVHADVYFPSSSCLSPPRLLQWGTREGRKLF